MAAKKKRFDRRAGHRSKGIGGADRRRKALGTSVRGQSMGVGGCVTDCLRHGRTVQIFRRSYLKRAASFAEIGHDV